MENFESWNAIFEKFVSNIVSPDGRETFESSDILIDKIINIACFEKVETIIDMGAGWGNLTLKIAPIVRNVIAIEPNGANLAKAEERSKDMFMKNITFIRGSFEKPNYRQKVDKIVSSFVFHQVDHKKKRKSLENIKKLLNKNGSFILCDTLMLFDPVNDPKQFNKVYRYLLPRTTPVDIYKRDIEPYFNNNVDYIYTWDDMKNYTPRGNWFYSLSDIKLIFNEIGMKIDDLVEVAPFFGIIKVGTINKEIE